MDGTICGTIVKKKIGVQGFTENGFGPKSVKIAEKCSGLKPVEIFRARRK
jgi:hypothetical protein